MTLRYPANFSLGHPDQNVEDLHALLNLAQCVHAHYDREMGKKPSLRQTINLIAQGVDEGVVELCDFLIEHRPKRVKFFLRGLLVSGAYLIYSIGNELKTMPWEDYLQAQVLQHRLDPGDEHITITRFELPPEMIFATRQTRAFSSALEKAWTEQRAQALDEVTGEAARKRAPKRI